MKNKVVHYSDLRFVFFVLSQGIKSEIVLKEFSKNIGEGKLLIITNSINSNSFITKLNCLDIIEYESEDLNFIVDRVKYFSPDFIVSCGWNKLIPKEIIEIPNIAAINCHSSYLPDYKGASIFKHAWSNLEKRTGATIHFLSEKFDEGNIIAQQEIKIFKRDTPYIILVRISELTVILLRESILLVQIGYPGISQAGGRYFFKKRNIHHIGHYILNRLRSVLMLKPIISKHKNLPND